jgi:hypothetical protein
MSENFVDHFEQFNWWLVVEFDHAQVEHERRPVELINSQFDFLCVKVGSLGECLALSAVAY